MKRLESAASNKTAIIGGTCLLSGVLLQALYPAGDPVVGALILVCFYLFPVAFYEIFGRKIHRRASTGLDWGTPREGDLRRVGIKLVGFTAIIAAVILVHAVFRIYAVHRLIPPLTAFIILAPFVAPIALVYFYQIDRRMTDPRDGYLELGNWILKRNFNPDWELLKNFTLGWAIKGFFLPVMFTYLVFNLPGLHDQFMHMSQGPITAVAFLAKIMVILELSIVVVGYSMTLKLFDAHIRSPNRLLGAWVVTLICYEPLKFIIAGSVIRFRHDQDWTAVIGDYPVMMWPWLGLILVSFFVWVWATAIFGLRWSNLTNRGIITNGPYAYTKHPDHAAKSIFFWLTAAPFLTAVSPWGALTASLALVVVNAIYFGRGRMEEKHLSDDPAYVEYALEMNRRSVFRHIARVFPALIYTAPDGRTGLENGHIPPHSAVPAE